MKSNKKSDEIKLRVTPQEKAQIKSKRSITECLD